MSQGQDVITRRDALKLAGGAASLAAVGTALPTVAEAAAPMLGVQRPQVYRFKLGNFEVTNILDGFVQNPSLHPTFGSDQPTEAVQALARSNGIPTNFDHHYVPTLVNTGKELVLFDTGNPRGRIPTAGKLPELSTGCRLPARAGRCRCHHPRPPRSHWRTGRGRWQAHLSQRSLRLRRGGVRLLEKGRKRTRGAQGQP